MYVAETKSFGVLQRVHPVANALRKDSSVPSHSGRKPGGRSLSSSSSSTITATVMEGLGEFGIEGRGSGGGGESWSVGVGDGERGEVEVGWINSQVCVLVACTSL